MNPFDLRGPEFLVVYAAFTLVLIFGLARLRKAREGAAPTTLPPISDPYAIAYLRGGQKAMLEVAAFSLVERGLLLVDDGTLATSGRHEAKLATNPLDKAILQFFQSRSKAFTMYRDAKFQGVSAAIEDRLRQDSLVPDLAIQEARSREFGIAVLILGGAAALKVIIALERGRSNVSFLILCAVVACALAYKVSFPRITKRGEQWLKDLNTLMSPLKRRAALASKDLGWREAAMVAAIYGLTAMRASAYPYIGQMFPAPDASSSTSSSCGSSSGGSSSSCGSACGGGGGGCGGCGS